MELVEKFSFTDRRGRTWVAPAGSRIDGASIPQGLWTLLGPPFIGDYRRASVVHDVACMEAQNRSDRRAADRMFFEACRAGGCSRRAAMILYIGVRIGAWWRYRVLLQEDTIEPRLVEHHENRALRQFFESTAEEILQAGETDDAAEIEARVDAAEPHMDARVLASVVASSGLEPSVVSARLSERVADEGLGPDHPALPLAAEQFYKTRLLDKPCGEEDRRPCDDSSRFPYSAICYLILNKSFGRTYRGTGFFVSPNTIVTAGHCLRAGMGSVQSVQIVPGRMGHDWPFESVIARRWYVPDEWALRGDVRFDYGVIKLSDSSLGERTGHFEIAAVDEDILLNTSLTTSGYPSDLELSTSQHMNSGPCDSVHDQRIEYHLDTWRGASGSPVWVERDGKPVVVAIHNYGHCPNFGTRINERVFADLQRWIDA